MAPSIDNLSIEKDAQLAVSARLEVLKTRADFLRAAKAKWKSEKGLTLQARKRHPNEPHPEIIRVGFTCSKKVGNAVARNRAKRRLREIARKHLPIKGHAGWDYVLIGRKDFTASRPFLELEQDLIRALAHLHGRNATKGRAS
ncbi:MAG: ribonuclease P protein component [Halocynthiibacter sp.]